MTFHSRSFQVKTFVKPAMWCKVEATLLIRSEIVWLERQILATAEYLGIQDFGITSYKCCWYCHIYAQVNRGGSWVCTKDKWDYKHHYSRAIEHQPNYQSFAVNLFSPAVYFLFISAGVLLYFYGKKKKRGKYMILAVSCLESLQCTTLWITSCYIAPDSK